MPNKPSVSRNVDALEEALAGARARLSAARAAALASGARPLRRLVAIARILRRGSPFTPMSPDAPASDQSALWRRHALDLEAEVDHLRGTARGACDAVADAERAAAAARVATKRYAIALARVEDEYRLLVGAAPPRHEEDSTTNYAAWIAATQPGAARLRCTRDMARTQEGPLFSFIVPVYKVPLTVLRDMVSSVQRQTYPHWELCIAHADVADAPARSYLRRVANADSRIRVLELDSNDGISANSNAAFAVATGDYIVLLDHDDMIVDHALSAFADVLAERPDTDFIYSDKDMTDELGRERTNPLFKPEWSPESMLTVNYLTHLNAIRASIVREIGGWRPDTDGAQDWDLFMRVTERTANVVAVRDVLYRWRMLKTSVAGGGAAAKPYALAAQIRTLEDALRRRGVAASFASEDDGLTLRPTWQTQPAGVTVVILAREDAGAIAAAEAIAARCPADVGEILVPTTERAFLTDSRIRIVEVDGASTPASRLADSLALASGAATVVIDGGTLVPDSDEWIADLVGPLMIPGVAVVGGKVFESYADRIARTGIVFHQDGSEADLFRGGHAAAYGIIGSAHWIRNVSAVAGGLIAVDTVVAREIGFHDAGDYPRADVDFCLRAFRAGHRIVYTPFLVSRELLPPRLSELRGDPVHGRNFVAALWPQGDPHFHPSLICDGPLQRMRLPAARPQPMHDYGAEAAALVTVFDAPNALISTARSAVIETAPWRTVTWVLPDFVHAYYGGVATILRFAAFLARVHGVVSTFAVLGILPPDVLERRILRAFPDLAGSRFVRVTSVEAMEDLPAADAGICTLWTTAYALLHAKVASHYYFVQDNEPQFYPAGSTSALAEATYRFGYRAICNTITLAQIVRSYGGEAVHFTPAVDPSIFHAGGRRAGGTRRRVFAYARPGHPRNGFELLARAIRTVKSELGDGVDIVTAGAPWSPAAYGLDGVLTNLGLLPYQCTGALYRSCDAGVVMMMTSHPSYLPMELMACGAAVVTNANPRTAWLLRDEDNAFLAETTATALSERLITVLAGDDARSRVAESGRAFVASQHADWDREWRSLTAQLWDERRGNVAARP